MAWSNALDVSGYTDGDKNALDVRASPTTFVFFHSIAILQILAKKPPPTGFV